MCIDSEHYVITDYWSKEDALNECLYADGEFSYIGYDPDKKDRICWICGERFCSAPRTGEKDDCTHLDMVWEYYNMQEPDIFIYCNKKKCQELGSYKHVHTTPSLNLELSKLFQVNLGRPRSVELNDSGVILLMTKLVEFKSKIQTKVNKYGLQGHMDWLYRTVEELGGPYESYGILHFKVRSLLRRINNIYCKKVNKEKDAMNKCA